ncbi:MAG: diphthine--ammonia ligase [Nanoarchaeota archaeon]|nr:diphthine--ammonia ligase [Nanoarchaeota archaeon]MBU1027726.1 diphthine--ammonia ligase [Nanoarchaeota archaeon]
MKLGILFSGGKDSCYAAYIVKQQGNELSCLISIFSQNQDSYMFHTPNIQRVKEQANVMKIPLIIEKTKGKKEDELKDLETAIKKAKTKYKIEGIVTGAIASEYQSSRIKKICAKLKLKCLNPLWHKDEIKYLHELINNKFKIIITGVAAYPLDKSWLGKLIDKKFVSDTIELNNKYKINAVGEGGEFETLVINCPLFSKPLTIKNKKISGSENSWKMDVDLA